jgi:hypothetical protein
MHLHQDPILAREEEEEVRKSARVRGKERERCSHGEDELEGGGELHLGGFPWPWPAMEARGAAFSWVGWRIRL